MEGGCGEDGREEGTENVTSLNTIDLSEPLIAPEGPSFLCFL